MHATKESTLYICALFTMPERWIKTGWINENFSNGCQRSAWQWDAGACEREPATYVLFHRCAGENIILTHAVSVGEPLREEGVRGIILMVLQNLGRGNSGVRLEILEMYREFLNKGITPDINKLDG